MPLAELLDGGFAAGFGSDGGGGGPLSGVSAGEAGLIGHLHRRRGACCPPRPTMGNRDGDARS
jgi:hypothetical protein